MHAIPNIIVWVFLIWNTCWMLKDKDWTDEDWDQVLPDLSNLCPSQQFCEKTQKTDNNVTSEENRCCLEIFGKIKRRCNMRKWTKYVVHKNIRCCSCDRNCSESRDCCWGDDDVISRKECLEPTSKQMNLRLKSYNFVSKPPTDGCKAKKCQDNEDNVTCSSEEMAGPWGNFYPVYSRSHDKNYKNAACARCHGVDDIEEWPGVLYSDSFLDFVGSFANLNEKNVLLHDYVVFSPPNEDSGSFDKLCFYEYDTCLPRTLDLFYIPSYVQMDRETIINACEQGPSAKYLERPGRVFKNVFCAICNSFTNRYLDDLKCLTTIDDSRTLSPAIRILLDADYMASIRMKSNSADKNRHIDCYRPTNSKNESICKELQCPSLQTRLQTGKCGYPAKLASFESIVICLNVSTTDEGADPLDVMNMSSSQTFALLSQRSPWSKSSWKIIAIGVRTGSLRGLEFLVCLVWKKQSFDLKMLHNQIKANLLRKWPMRFDQRVEFDQKFSKHGKVDGHADTNMEPDWGYYQRSPKLVNLTAPIWKGKYSLDKKILITAFYVDEMLLCEQIELSPDEYELENPGGVLYLPSTQDILYPGQYTLLDDNDGSMRVRVCLKDSGYSKVVSGTGIEKNVHHLVMCSLVIALWIGGV